MGACVESGINQFGEKLVVWLSRKINKSFDQSKIHIQILKTLLPYAKQVHMQDTTFITVLTHIKKRLETRSII